MLMFCWFVILGAKVQKITTDYTVYAIFFLLMCVNPSVLSKKSVIFVRKKITKD